jgi:hypothetical protein
MSPRRIHPLIFFSSRIGFLFSMQGTLGDVCSTYKVEQSMIKRWMLRQQVSNWRWICVPDPSDLSEMVPLGQVFSSHSIPKPILDFIEKHEARSTDSVLQDYDCVRSMDWGAFKDLPLNQNPFPEESEFDGTASIENEIRKRDNQLPRNELNFTFTPLSLDACLKLADLFDPRNGHKESDPSRYSHRPVQGWVEKKFYKSHGHKDLLLFDKVHEGIMIAADVKLSRAMLSLFLTEFFSTRFPYPDVMLYPQDVIFNGISSVKWLKSIEYALEKYGSYDYRNGFRSNVLVSNNTMFDRYWQDSQTVVKDQSVDILFPGLCHGFVEVEYSVSQGTVSLDMLGVFALIQWYRPHRERLSWSWAPLAQLWTCAKRPWHDIVLADNLCCLIPVSQLKGKFIPYAVPYTQDCPKTWKFYADRPNDMYPAKCGDMYPPQPMMVLPLPHQSVMSMM